LEHIISYLPPLDIAVASGVNKTFHNVVAGSIIAQSKLFLRPSGRAKDVWVYGELSRVMRSNGRERRIEAQFFELSIEAYKEKRDELMAEMSKRVYGISKWVSVVSLCPLLELDDPQESTAFGRLKRLGWQDDERANLTTLPAENTRYADMILTDPPVDEIHVELTYKHDLRPLLMIRAARRVTSTASPLTIGAVLDSACSELGPLYLHDPPTGLNNYHASHMSVEESSINEMMAQQVREHRGRFALDLTNTQFFFRNSTSSSGHVVNRIIVPSAEERLSMEVKRVR
jgi:hypothetical protein